jgi:hypothetical protein
MACSKTEKKNQHNSQPEINYIYIQVQYTQLDVFQKNHTIRCLAIFGLHGKLSVKCGEQICT